MSDIKFINYIGKKLSKNTLDKFNFYHYINGECPKYVEKMERSYEDYDESLIKDELPDDCWVTRKYVPEGCCIRTNVVLAFELDEEYTIKDITYMVEYVHRPSDFIPYIELEDNVGNWYGFQGLSTPYMIEDYFEEIINN